jgi:hypothetical protein
MTARRQEMKVQWLELARTMVVGLAATGAVAAPMAFAATTERLVVDRFTGLALGGTDPVAYFTDAKVLTGRPEIELSAQGAVWRFRSEDNRAFFLASPNVYAPQFGGYDPVDVARGVPVAGLPRLWVIHGERLYLFSREQSRAAFAANPDGVLHAAATSWPGVRKTLAQ